MKRALVRVSALAAVLVAGFFVVSLVRRGLQGAGEQVAHGADGVMPQTDPGRAQAADPLASPDSPRTLPFNPRVNPIRSGPGAAGVNPVRATAAADDVPAGSAPVKRLDVPAPSAAPKAVDPFGLRTADAPNEMRQKSLADLGWPATATDGNPPPTARQPQASVDEDAPARPPANVATPREIVGQRTTTEPALLKQASSPAGAATPRAISGPQLTGPRLSAEADSAEPARSDTVRSDSPRSDAARSDSGRSEGSRFDAARSDPFPPAATRSEIAQSSPARLDAAPTDSSRGTDGSGKPGGRHLEGPQVPQITIQKVAPAEIQVGKAATFHIKLHNSGQVPANNVEVRDEVPQGARLVATNPRASRGVRGELLWQLGTIKPGAEATLEVQLMPVDEGEIGSVATVSFAADATARAVATKPQLAVKATGPAKALVGDEVTLAIVVSNPGSGVAQKVVLEERVPAGLQHAAGPELQYEIGDLKPNESRQLELKLTATQAGRIRNKLVARGEGSLTADDRVDIDVLAPQLDVSMEGRKRPYLEREATYILSVSNPGTAPAKQVQLTAYLPPGLKFVSADNAGQYDEATRSVHWLLEELPVKESGSVALVTMPVATGAQTLRLSGSAKKGVAVEKEQPVVVEGIAAIHLEVAATADPIAVQGETTYEVRVVNQGSKAATNVQLTVTLPPEMRFVAAEGPTRQTGDRSPIIFEPLPRMEPKANTTYRVRVQGLKPGDLRIRASLLTDESRTPVVKEESTHVYSDE